MSDELNYFDFFKKMEEKFDIEYAIENRNLEFFKRYLISKKDDFRALSDICFMYNNKEKIIKSLGYDYIFCSCSFDEYRKLPNLVHLNLNIQRIENLASLQLPTSLKTLSLDRCRIESLASLQILTSLETLDLWCNFITDISPLASLIRLRKLNLSVNQNYPILLLLNR